MTPESKPSRVAVLCSARGAWTEERGSEASE